MREMEELVIRTAVDDGGTTADSTARLHVKCGGEAKAMACEWSTWQTTSDEGR